MVVVMEGRPTAHLKNVLKRYQQAARNTLNGPGRFEASGNTSSSSNSSGSETSSNTSSPHQLTVTTSNPSNFDPGQSPASGAGVGPTQHLKVTTHLLHQHLQQSQQQQSSNHHPHHHLSSSSSSINYDNIKKERSHYDGEERPSSFVPVPARRSSGGAVEIANRMGSDSQIRIAQIGRSKSSPATASEVTSFGNSSSGGSGGGVPNNINSSSSSSSPSSLKQLPLPLALPPPPHFLGNANNSKSSPPALSPSAINSNSSGGGVKHHHRESSSTSPITASAPSLTVSSLRSPSIGISGTRAAVSGGTTVPHSTTALMRDTVSSFPPPPIFSTPDRSRTEKKETLLEGQYISCFVVGGEKRLCFPQILTSVLRGFTLPQINKVCDELQIYCSRCSTEQLELLKVCGVLPINAASCGLIKKTDAERLVNSLLHRNPPKAALAFPVARPKDHFWVYHKCFGKSKGIVSPHLFDKPDALCIECVDCRGLFSPARFVAHSHHRSENQTVHWGFDSANWRHYLMLCKKHKDPERWQAVLVDFKAKFDHKRKELRSSPVDELDDHVVIKKIRCDSVVFPVGPHPPAYFGDSPTSISCLPTKKRPPFHQYSTSNNDQISATTTELDRVKKMLINRLGPDGAAVNNILDTMAKKISSLEQICASCICRDQEKFVRDVSQAKAGVELQSKVNVMEAELRSLKKQLLHRHHIQSDI